MVEPNLRLRTAMYLCDDYRRTFHAGVLLDSLDMLKDEEDVHVGVVGIAQIAKCLDLVRDDAVKKRVSSCRKCCCAGTSAGWTGIVRACL